MYRAISLAGVALFSSAAACAAIFNWDGQCGSGWCDCCDCGADLKCNSWVVPASPAPVCPVLPIAVDDVFIMGDVVVNCVGAQCYDLTQTGMLTVTPGGSLGIAGTGVINGPLLWTGGEIGRASGASGQMLTVTGGITLSGAAPKTLANLGGFTLVNEAAGAWQGGDWTIGQIPGGVAPAIFENAATGVFEIQTDADVLATAFGLGVFRNAGLLRKTTAGDTRVTAIFDNLAGAEFALEAGEFRPRAGSNRGTIDIAAGALFAIQDGAAFTLNATSLITGAGSFRVGGAGSNTAILTMDPAADIDTERLELQTFGQIGGTGDLTITERMDWTGGQMNDSGGLTIAPGALLAIDGAEVKRNFARDLRIEGVATVDGAGLFDRANMTVAPGGTLTVRGAGGLAGGLIVNQGSVILDPPANARYTFQTLQNAGYVEIRNHEVQFEFAPYNQSAGETRLVNGALRCTVTLNGGALTGAGNVFFNTTNVGGTVAPGADTEFAILHFGPGLSHHYFQAAGGTLRIKLGGNAPGVNQDQILIGDVFGLGGTLDVRLADGFLPPIGAQFEIARAGNRTDGAFAAVLSPPQRAFRAFRSGASVFVEVIARPGDMNCDGAVNFDDIDGFIAALVGQAAYESLYPDCQFLNADANGNGAVNFDDIDPFIVLLIGG